MSPHADGRRPARRTAAAGVSLALIGAGPVMGAPSGEARVVRTATLGDTPLGAFSNRLTPGTVADDRGVNLGGIGSDPYPAGRGRLRRRRPTGRQRGGDDGVVRPAAAPPLTHPIRDGSNDSRSLGNSLGMSLGNCDGSPLGNSLGSRVGRLNDGLGEPLVLVAGAGSLSGESSFPEAMKTTTRATAAAAAITASRANSGLRRLL
ncbi:hypothetical protein QFZ22_008573 [Streptomyces canus]|uniref:Uncharacterized protein n=1 Tax=Streptomyces canus TaxID=58343 RepID=A0AAW8FSN3_9ACTN|nr:hypothetical protein [Streptomyces canus]